MAVIALPKGNAYRWLIRPLSVICLYTCHQRTDRMSTARTIRKRIAYFQIVRPVSLLLCLNSLPILLLWIDSNENFPSQFCNLLWADLLLMMMLRFFQRRDSANQTKPVSVRVAVSRSRLFSRRGFVRLVAALLLCCIVSYLFATIKSPALVDGNTPVVWVISLMLFAVVMAPGDAGVKNE